MPHKEMGESVVLHVSHVADFPWASSLCDTEERRVCRKESWFIFPKENIICLLDHFDEVLVTASVTEGYQNQVSL